MLNAIVASALLASTAYGHFTLDYPKSRGFIDDKATEFCGGFNSPSERSPYPLNSAPVWIDSHHTKANVIAFITTNPDPKSFADFNTTANGTEIPVLTNWFQVPTGENCWNIDLEKLNIGLTNGTEATILIQYDGGDSNLYQCADVVLLSNYTVPSNETCTKDAAVANTTESANTTATGTQTGGSNSSTSTTAKPTPSSGAERLAAGAMGVLALAAAAAVL